MKLFLLLTLVLSSVLCNAQKYILIDKKMRMPLAYTDNVTVVHSYKGYFAVEKIKVKQVLAEIEKIAQKLSTGNIVDDSFNYKVGRTSFVGLKIPLAKDERYDVVLSTDCGQIKSRMHLSDAKITNSSNAYYIKTWLKYIRENLK
ncbi:MAG: hypothetical protein ABJA57_03925 [Ginsengibacter sp.]